MSNANKRKAYVLQLEKDLEQEKQNKLAMCLARYDGQVKRAKKEAKIKHLEKELAKEVEASKMHAMRCAELRKLREKINGESDSDFDEFGDSSDSDSDNDARVQSVGLIFTSEESDEEQLGEEELAPAPVAPAEASSATPCAEGVAFPQSKEQALAELARAGKQVPVKNTWLFTYKRDQYVMNRTHFFVGNCITHAYAYLLIMIDLFNKGGPSKGTNHDTFRGMMAHTILPMWDRIKKGDAWTPYKDIEGFMQHVITLWKYIVPEEPAEWCREFKIREAMDMYLTETPPMVFKSAQDVNRLSKRNVHRWLGPAWRVVKKTRKKFKTAKAPTDKCFIEPYYWCHYPGTRKRQHRTIPELKQRLMAVHGFTTPSDGASSATHV